MAVSQMNTGQDYALFFYDGATGGLVNLGDVQNVKISALKHTIKSQPFNAPSRYGYVPDGYEVHFTITRTGPDLENFMVQAEANFNAGQVQKSGFLQQTITNPDGSISRYQYTNMVLFLTDHGDISKDKTVALTLEGYASSKIQIS